MSRIVFATDLHLLEGRDSLAAFATDLEEIAALQPDLLVQGGDACLWTADAGVQLLRLLEPHGLRTVHVMGNHDTTRDVPAEAFDRDFTASLGPRNTCTELGDAHVVTLNTCRMQPQFSDWRNVRAEVADDDLAWLDATLSALPRDRPLLLFVHIPLATTYPERRGADRVTTDVWRVTNAEAVHTRLAAWPQPVVVGQGHLHENEHLHRDGVHYVSVGSVCGRWWQQGADSRCVDDSPRGWLLVDVEAGRCELGYLAARGPADWVGEIVGGEPDWLNLFFADPAEPVEIERDGAWEPLPAPTPYPVDADFVSTHHWALPAGVGDAVRVRSRLRGGAWELGTVRRAGD